MCVWGGGGVGGGLYLEVKRRMKEGVHDIPMVRKRVSSWILYYPSSAADNNHQVVFLL